MGTKREEPGDLLTEHRPNVVSLGALVAVALGMLGFAWWFMQVGIERGAIGMGLLGVATCASVALAALWGARLVWRARVDVHRNGLVVGRDRVWVGWREITELRVVRKGDELRALGIVARGREHLLGPGLTAPERVLEAIEDARPDLRGRR